MGSLLLGSKSYFLGLLKCLNSLSWYFIFFSLINLSFCIYEDQIGKFDWQQSYVGRIKFAQFDTSSTAKRIIIATEENVVAALNLKTGQVMWKRVFESDSFGDIHMLHVGERIVSINGYNPYIVRGWDPTTGVLVFEWAMTLQDTERAHLSKWWVENNMLVHLLPVFGSHLEVTTYNLQTGENKGVSSKLPAVWSNEGCILTQPYYICVSGGIGSENVIAIDVTGDAVQLISQPLYKFFGSDPPQGVIRPFDGVSALPGFIINDEKVVILKNNEFELMQFNLKDPTASVAVVDSSSGPVVMQTWYNYPGSYLALTAHKVSTSEEVAEVQATFNKFFLPNPEIAAAMCTRNPKEQFACRVLVNGDDNSANLLQQAGRILWTREEALANVVTAKFVDLPVSDLDAAIELEFDHKEGSVWAAFSRRLHTQWQQLTSFVQSWTRREHDSEQGADSLLVRDYFNLHKVIVLVTEVGKIFGMDNLSGNILWHRHIPTMDTEGVTIYLRRTARHPPHDSYITVVAKHEDKGIGLLVSLNPITGAYIEEKILELQYKLLQSAMLHITDDDHVRPIVLLDQHGNVEVLPKSATDLVKEMYMFVANKQTAVVQGYALKYYGDKVHALRTWAVNLSGGDEAKHHIVSITPKNPDERAHSPGKVMGDRSVLYKYLNPNLVLFITEGSDPVHKDVVSAWCIDVVSGAVVFAQSHRRASSTPHAVHSDNFIAYVYFNDKHRRTEIASVELYEGNERWSPAGTGFSSFTSDRVPLSERQSYIVPGFVTAAGVTTTERSITDKNVLLGMLTGAIVEMPWLFLEPRRSPTPTNDQREEGVIPYAPELPLLPESTINYNLTLYRINKIFTAPAGLESTSLVLATGLDLFYTRVAPSKTFDLLKDDFDYYLISVVLAALVVATYSTKYFASRKALKQAWK